MGQSWSVSTGIALGEVLRGNQGGIHDRALPHRHAPRTELGIDGLNDLLSKTVLLQEVEQGVNYGLIQDPTSDPIEPAKRHTVGASIIASA